MAEFRKITEVEEISELTGDENILVNDHGYLKQINKKNAKLGGGVTVFTVNLGAPQPADLGVSTAEISGDSILKEDGTETTAQEIYDAFMSGSVILKITNSSGELQCCQILSVVPLDESQNSFDGTNVAFIVLYYASGTKIKEIVWPASSGGPAS